MRKTVEVRFRDVDYILDVSTQGSTLTVIVEETENGARWKGEFSSKYIEDMTAKVGNFKSFGVFEQMLGTALTTISSTVFLDLLTYGDLELLRAGTSSNAPADVARLSQKRFLILTYASQFDRNHYALPLAPEGAPDTSALQAALQKMRAERDEARAQVVALTEELEAVKKQAAAAVRAAASSSSHAYRSSHQHSSNTSLSNPKPGPRSSRANSSGRLVRSSSNTSRASKSSVRSNRSARSSSTRGVSRSASPYRRFDPTAYVQEQKERMAARRAAAGLSGGGPPRPSSVGAHARRDRTPSPGPGRRIRPPQSPAAGGRLPRTGSSTSSTSRLRRSSSLSSTGRENRPPQHPYQKSSASRQQQQKQVTPRGSGGRSSSSVGESPSRKLVNSSSGGRASFSLGTTGEEDIDARLSALQSFLQQAKASQRARSNSRSRDVSVNH